MEAILFSKSSFETTFDCIELALSLDCNNIWVWFSYENQDTYNALKKEQWEDEVNLFYCDTVQSIGDCLREMYMRDESRSNLLIIGDLDHLPQKLSLHKNGFGKNVGTIMFADGNVGYAIKKGRLDSYGWLSSKQKGMALDIAYCSPIILGIFNEHFDCDTFHDLLLTDTLKHNYGIRMDKRIKCFIDPPSDSDTEESEDFMMELEKMLEIDLESAKLELNSLRMAHGLLYKDLISGLKELNASQELLDCLLS